MLGASATLREQAQGGRVGVRALWSNRRVFYIAMFASFVSSQRLIGDRVHGVSLRESTRFANLRGEKGGLLYGYQQGVLGQALVMHTFGKRFPHIVSDSSSKGWLTSILQLGGWIGALSAGVLCEIYTRKHTIFAGALWVVLGSYLTAGAASPAYLYAGRFFTGIGVGILSATG